MRYLIVFEDGKLYQSDEIDEETIEGCLEGYLDIVDTKESKYFVERDVWEDLNKWQ